MNYKKIVLAVSFLAVFSLLFVPARPAVKAITDTERQVLITQLQQQIALLLAQIAQLQAQQGITPAWCHTFNANIGIGVKEGNPEVEALVIALQKEGIIEAGATFPDGYDERLASAVVEFQEKYASDILTPLNLKRGTGFVGISTRAKLNALYGCRGTLPPPPLPPTAQPSITVLSPNGGDIWRKDALYTINWQTSNIPNSNLITVSLRSEAGVEYNLSSVTNIQKRYVMNFQFPTPSMQLLPLGRYKAEVKTILNNQNYLDTSDNYFSIVAPTTTCVPNWTCTAWNACASDQQTRSCADSNNCGVMTNSETQSCTQPPPPPPPLTEQCAGQNSPNYYQKGSVIYRGVTLQDSCLNSSQLAEYYCAIDRTNYKYEVYNCPQGCQDGVCKTAQPRPSITVLSPNGGEKWVMGSSATIKWTSSNIPATHLLEVNLRGSGGEVIPLLNNVINDGIEIIPTVLVRGFYKLEIQSFVGDYSVFDASNGYFEIVLPAEPSITVLSPNGGETWQHDSVQSVRWITSKIPDSNSVTVRLRSEAGVEYNRFPLVPNGGIIYFFVPSILSAGKWKAEVSTFYNGQSYLDASDNYFNILP
ncbi:MAG: hypothetical protein HYT35_00635 [Candidatus Staskawiczbacteria bacterium]|nr:hypothetical protein [Candidatus Staskawiczbacteria bacterium]